ncbi:MAG TPA: flagellar biosynthesis protein FliO [Rhizobium sp.]|nr:flagellar biosynthesis protein FliO [Rhizobium sp.]
MLQELVAAYGNRFVVAALGVSLALLCLFVVLWLLRRRAPSPFVRGGRNRQPRLQVLDAAAVDARRRLVLVRRDNVEHLIMIGGPTDIVVESGIGDERPYLSAIPVSPDAMRLAHEAPAPDAAPAAIAQPQPEPTTIPVTAEPSPAMQRPIPANASEERPRPTIPVRPPTPPAAEPAAPVAQALPLQPKASTIPPGPPAAPAPIAPVVAAPEPGKSADTSSIFIDTDTILEAGDSRVMPDQTVVAPPAPDTAISAAEASAPIRPEVPSVSIDPAEILEAARSRVMPNLPASVPMAQPDIQPALQISEETPVPDDTGSRRIPSDFERVLEEEMAIHLAATAPGTEINRPEKPFVPEIRPDRPVSIPPIPSQPTQEKQSAATGDEPNLQNEIARIFGEMSVNRNG